MKKTFLLLLASFLVFGLSLNALDKENPVKDATGLAPRQLFGYSESQPTGFPNPGDDPDYQAYAYNAYDPSAMMPEGPVTYILNNPAGLTSLAASATDFLASACWVAEDEAWYGVVYGGGLYTIDIVTGWMTYVAPSIGLHGLEFDDDSGVMYGSDGAALYTVNRTTGATTLIGSHNIADTMIGLGGDGAGNMYGVSVSFTAISPLYSINLATGAATSIGSTGGQLLYAQDLAFDKDAGTLYSAAYFGDGTPPGLYTINTTTCAMTLVGNFPNGMEVSGFAIPYSLAEPGAPAAPSNVVITPGATGSLQCAVSWTCPTLTFAGDPLTELLEMRVYRNGVLVYTDTSPVIGGNGSYTDFPAAAGLYDYDVLGYNTQGEGPGAGEEVWVGPDVPNAITNLVLTDVSGATLVAQLNWTNPTTGFHGGYFTGCTGYNIVRSDGTPFTVTGSTTQWQDINVPAPGVYSYTVTPYNASGSGPSTTSAQVGIGVSIIQVGNQETGDYQIPINLWYMDSMVEVIYLQQWLGSDMLINTVSFHANTSTNVTTPFHLEIWLGETTQNDLSAGWITGADLTQCYSGNITVPSGDSWIDIPLNSPFEYTFAGNLVMMIIRDDSQYFSTADLWWCTESNTPYRTRYDYTDYSSGQYYNANTGPFTSTQNKTIYPDVRFYYSPLEHGDVGGTVTNSANNNPISGVEVTVGNWGPATTNASGQYLIEDIVTGLQPVFAHKEGFYDFFGEVNVLANQLVTYNIVMSPNVYGGLEGTVTDVGTGAPLVGAEIYAVSTGGYEYDAITNATGYYLISNVVAETYDVYCSYPNYPTEVVEDVVILEGAVTIVDFAMEGYAYWNNFESNDGGLISDNPSGWQWGAFTSGPNSGYSGTNGWATLIAGNYPNNANFRLDTPIPFFVQSPLAMLEFWHWYEIESSWDGGNVKVSTDGGTSWTVIEPLTGYTGTANSSNPLYPEPIFCGYDYNYWHSVQFDLSAYQGQSIYIRWQFGSDGSVQYPGWYIDDVAISGCGVPDPGSLEGFVTVSGSGVPIQGATVTLVGSGFSATTAADGSYLIPSIWPGNYDVSCTAPLYLNALEPNFTIAPGVNTLNFSMLWSEIDVSVDELVSYLPPDESEVQTFTITNNGPGNLEYSISFEYPAEVSVRRVPPVQKVQSLRTVPDTGNQIEAGKTTNSGRDESPFISRSQSEISRDMWDLQFSFDATAASGAAGNAGSEFDGTYFYTTRWASNLIHKYDINGNLVQEFSIPGVTGLRDLAYDGAYFYGGAAGNVIYQMDFNTQTLIGTINSSVAVRAIAYNDDLDAFYVSNFADPVGLISRNGTTLQTFNCGLAATYGFAYDNLTGGQYLWIFDQGAGAGAAQLIHQMDTTTNTMTGVTHNVSLELPDPSGIAGGLFLTTDFVPGIVTLGGLQQGVPDQVFCYELAPYSTWVSVTNNISGTVPGNGGSIVVEVTFNAEELLIGDVLTADMLIQNNSNYGGTYVIPVTLNVTGFIPPSNLFVDVNTWLFTWDAPPGPNLLGYNVYLDDMNNPIGTTANTQWQYVDLVGGTSYTAGVSAVYDDGVSQIAQYEFTAVSTGDILPLITALKGNYPNPFNPETKILFSLHTPSHVNLSVYNVKGQLIKTLVDGELAADYHHVIWDGRDASNKPVSSGVYFYKMKADKFLQTKKMILMK